jgi:peptide-methionine (S)-S-oxide reductase
MSNETATLAGGCFWCQDAVFRPLKGVAEVVSGFTGGYVQAPSYEQVVYTDTGHAEAVQIQFDPAVITYRDLLNIFFATHDPTTLNRQGADVGSQYRSAIYYHSPEQEQAAREIIAALAKENVFGRPIVTEVEPAGEFYPAEGYHQDYFARNPSQGYCQVVIAPKVAKMRKEYGERLKVRS